MRNRNQDGSLRSGMSGGRREWQLNLIHLLGEISSLNVELEKRREESVRIQELYEDRCRVLRRNVAELEDEVEEL